MPPEGTNYYDEIFSSHSPTNSNNGSYIHNATKKNELLSKPRICSSVIDSIGNTPLIRLNKIPQSVGIECEVLVKCEFYGPGGSHKDRIALQMIEDAERAGKLKPGMTIIEPTSGNTGIALALVAAVKGYKTIFVTPEKNSQEKFDLMTALGAKVVKTPNGVPYSGPYSHVSIAKRLNKEIPNSIVLDQYENPGNPEAHYKHTSIEILDQCDGRVDMMVVGAGTGGAISGIAKRFKESCPECQIVAVDPEGSIQASPSLMNTIVKGYEVEGIGHADFIPGVLDYSNIDKWYKTNDKESLEMARRLIKEEGLLVGGSCGAAVAGALKAIKEAGLKRSQRCVILLPDSVRNYMTKFISDGWMLEKNLIQESEIPNPNNYSWWTTKASELGLEVPMTIEPTVTIREAITIMKFNRLEQLPVVDTEGTIKGLVTLTGLMSKLLSTTSALSPRNTVEGAMNRQFKKVNGNTTLAKLVHILQGGHSALIVQTPTSSSKEQAGKETIVGLVTQLDILDYVSKFEHEEL